MSASDVWEIARIEALAPDQKSVAAARALLTADTFSQVEPTSDGRGWWAVCQGATDLYRVAVRPTADGFDCECSCPSRKYPCKHALALLVYLADRPALRVTAGRVGRAPADFEGLVRAVFAAPADDLPRLVFADYLDETGRPDRAALIRTQCEMARIGGADPQFPALAEAEHDLTARLREEVGEFPEGFGGEFHRGFLRLGVNADAFGRIASLPARVVNLFLYGW
ncbi:MAG TPA: TIGR02996 domain-containing protein, partial [Gemmataceae bacterium]|nr:TIGR02996 domain-containing protein [Gemmataceae bacterium]